MSASFFSDTQMIILIVGGFLLLDAIIVVGLLYSLKARNKDFFASLEQYSVAKGYGFQKNSLLALRFTLTGKSSSGKKWCLSTKASNKESDFCFTSQDFKNPPRLCMISPRQNKTYPRLENSMNSPIAKWMIRTTLGIPKELLENVQVVDLPNAELNSRFVSVADSSHSLRQVLKPRAETILANWQDGRPFIMVSNQGLEIRFPVKKDLPTLEKLIALGEAILS